ncbi:MAG: hypothetical protein ABIA78_00820 [archaeon]
MTDMIKKHLIMGRDEEGKIRRYLERVMNGGSIRRFFSLASKGYKPWAFHVEQDRESIAFNTGSVTGFYDLKDKTLSLSGSDKRSVNRIAWRMPC